MKEIGVFFWYWLTIGGSSQVPVDGAEWDCRKYQFSNSCQVWNTDNLPENSPDEISKAFPASQTPNCLETWRKKDFLKKLGQVTIAKSLMYSPCWWYYII